MYIVALLIATALPLIALFAMYRLDLYGTGSFKIILLSFAWGVIGFGLAYFVNPLTVTLDIARNFSEVQRLYAPIIEEILKGLILLYLVRRADFTYFVDGAIYGFAIGIGFAVAENYQYVFDSYNVLGTAISRVLSTNLMHATASALIGIALGFARFQKLPQGGLSLLTGLLLAMGVHAGYNNLVTRVSSSLLLLYAVGVSFAGVGFIVFMIKRGLTEGREWIRETLGEADRVTEGEKKVVDRLSDISKLLTPVRERFGAEKTRDVERFLKLQAQLGIKRKTLEKLNDEKMIAAVENQMDEIRADMDDVRRDVGAYVMLYVRGIIPPDTSPLWDHLQNAVDERIAARTENAGPSLWDQLGDRTAKAASSSDSIDS